MWDIYVKPYLKRNRAASVSVLSIVLLAVIFISFLVTLFYNLWLDEQVRAAYEGRTWQPALLMTLYGVILLIICMALLIMIYYAFEMTKDGRIHQLGILQSVGATPGQIFTALMEEAFALGVLPLIPGMLPGICLTWLFTEKANEVNRTVGNMETQFVYHPFLFFLTAALCLLTVWMAAARSALHLSRMGVLEAVRGRTEELFEKRKRRFVRTKSTYRNVERELARRSMRVKKRAFRTASISLTLSCLAFSLFLNLWVISSVSRQITYFDRYWNTWDAQRQALEITHEKMIESAYMLTMGGMCALLAGIGIASIFANLMGSIRLRRREFARYQSVGFSTESLWRLLILEAAEAAVRPILISVPVNVLFVLWAVSISPPTIKDYLEVMPVLPLAAFAGSIAVAAGLACFLSGRRIMEADIVESLKDDTLY